MILSVLGSLSTILLGTLVSPLAIPIAFLVTVFAASMFTSNATAELLGAVIAASIFYVIVQYVLPKIGNAKTNQSLKK